MSEVMKSSMMEDVNKRVKDLRAKLANTEDKCSDMRKQLREAERDLAIYKQGLEAGAQFNALLEGMVDGGMDRDIAIQLIMLQVPAVR